MINQVYLFSKAFFAETLQVFYVLFKLDEKDERIFSFPKQVFEEGGVAIFDDSDDELPVYIISTEEYVHETIGYLVSQKILILNLGELW